MTTFTLTADWHLGLVSPSMRMGENQRTFTLDLERPPSPTGSFACRSRTTPETRRKSLLV